MDLKEKLTIDLLAFFKSGKFDIIRLKQTKEWILSNFPEPDSRFSPEMLKNGFDIWTYGDIEFHFEKQELFLIYTDHLERLGGGKKLALDKWILEEPEKLNLLYVLTALDKNDVAYRQKSNDQDVTLRLSSGVELTFGNVNQVENLSANEFPMTSFALIAESPNRWK